MTLYRNAELLKNNPAWTNNPKRDIAFLIHIPEADYPIDDENTPYFTVKRFLLKNGIPNQMVDTTTLVNPDWKDLNLAMNIVAKCGIIPWVLPNALPCADFFIGLSYTTQKGVQSDKIMGYTNIFNKYGRWMFYNGNNEVFDYNDRAKYYEKLITDTISKLNLNDSPYIHFHYSARFSKEDITIIENSVKRVKPDANLTFCWINDLNIIRAHNESPTSDGTMERGKYFLTSNKQFYLSTTGENPYRKNLGSPVLLEVNVQKSNDSIVDLNCIAKHVFSLTKLNFASTESICSEPITIKYAKDIARLTSAFLRQGKPFKIGPALENTPWFI